MMGRSFGWCWLFVMLTQTAFAQGAPDPRKVYLRILPSVMMLEVTARDGDRFVGSGVLALRDDVAVTAWHVVRDAVSVVAVFHDGEKVNVTGRIDHDRERDLALVKLERPMVRRQAALHNKLEPVATRAYAIGTPKGSPFSITDGLISQVRRLDGFDQYQVSCPISPGNSGGPVVNQRGQVIGITSWTKTDAQNMSFAVPIKELARLDPSKKEIPWTRLNAAEGQTRATATSVRNASVTSGASGETGDDFERLKERLRRSAGKEIVVVVHDGAQEETFSLRVPSDSRADPFEDLGTAEQP